MNIYEIMTRRDFIGGAGAAVGAAAVGSKITPDKFPGTTSPMPPKKPAAPQKSPIPVRRLPEEIVRAVIWQESRGVPTRINKKSGASGLMQILPSTWAKPGYGMEPGPKGKIMDPKANVIFGSSLLQSFLTHFDGNMVKTLAAYNWGPTNVANWDGDSDKLPTETQNYILQVVERAKGERPTFTGKL